MGILLDSNILIYSINVSSPKCKISQSFILSHANELVVAHQNILEAIRVLTHPKFPNPMTVAGAQKAIEAIVVGCRIIYPNDTTYHLAWEQIKEHNLSGNKIFDAYLAATALSNGIHAIATDNLKDFRKFHGLKVHDISVPASGSVR